MPVYVSYDLHLEFTQKTIDSIRKASHTNHEYKVMVVSSYCKPVFKKDIEAIADLTVYNEKNGVSIAWNTGILHGIDQKYEYILVINNDLLFHTDALDNIITFAETHKEFSFWTCAEWKGKNNIEERIAIGNLLKGITYDQNFDEHPHFSAFMLTPDFVNKLKELEKDSGEPQPGMFDESFAPAYFEDGDMHNRILRAGMKAVKTGSAIFYHFGSRSIQVDNELFVNNGRTYEKNRNYFINKWGFDPHNSVVENDSPQRYNFKKPFNGK